MVSNIIESWQYFVTIFDLVRAMIVYPMEKVVSALKNPPLVEFFVIYFLSTVQKILLMCSGYFAII